MNKLLALLLLSPMAFAEPSKETKEYLWERPVSLLTFGLHECNRTLNLEKEKEKQRHDYLKISSIYCDYLFDTDQIMLTAAIVDFEKLYDSLLDVIEFKNLERTGELTLDQAQEGCQKVSQDLYGLGMSLTERAPFNPFISSFSNTGIVRGGTDVGLQLEHVANMFALTIRLSTIGDNGYTCKASAKDKRYPFGEKINFAVKQESSKDFYGVKD